MEKNNKITINSNPGYGYNLSRTSYDARQGINAKVIGVLKYNNDIRKRLLKRNIGVYPLMDTEMGIGYIPDFFSFDTRKPLSLGEEGLLGYTHITKSSFQENINKKYDIGDYVQYYQHGSLPDSNNLKWNGNYDDYTEYVNKVFGFPKNGMELLSKLFGNVKSNKTDEWTYAGDTFLTIRSVLNDFLQYDSIKYAMEKTRIGTVTPNPMAALSGVVTTNINNFSGTDTPLGIITNYLYAHMLRDGAQFNSLRRTPYITPKAYSNIGNKLSTLATLSSDFRIDNETGRLAFTIGDDISTISYEDISIEDFENESIVDSSNDVFFTQNARYRNIVRNKFKPFENKRYSINGKFKSLNTYLSPIINGKVFYIWDEGENSSWNNSLITPINEDVYVGIEKYEASGDNLIAKTRQLFNSHNEKGIDTLISRFHTTGGRDVTHNEASLFQTAVTKYGMSHGRNLLNKNAYNNKSTNKDNGYDNPYCRVWTNHHQYSKISDLTRPFIDYDKDKPSIIGIDKLQQKWFMYGRDKEGANRLKNNTVLNRNGFVNITPTNDADKDSVDVKKCMFSIENLAWKDVLVKEELTKEQIGPNGGRIMWFPPYGLKFQESVNVGWESNEFIGRGEKIYTYKNTERGGTLSFTLLVDHPSILDMWRKNGATKNDFDDEQTLLRFFAGCEVLELNNIPANTTKEENITPPEIVVDETPMVEADNESDIIFYIFFPNYYTGNDGKSLDDVISYIADEYESNKGGDYTESIYEGYKWAYRVDDDYKNRVLRYDANYHDTINYKFNKDLDSLKNTSYSDATISFQALTKQITTIMSENHITGAIIQGFSSSHGDKKDNIIIQEDRALFAKEFLEKYTVIKNFEIKKGVEINVDDIDKENISGRSAKLARCAKVILKTLKRPVVDPLSNATLPQDEPNVENVSLTFNSNEKDTVQSKKLTRKQKRARRKNERKEYESLKESLKNSVPVLVDSETQTKLLNDGNNVLNEQNNIDFSQMLSNNKVLSATQYQEREAELRRIKAQRWENESQYFEKLQDNDSFLYSRVIDKVKYFTPAFHSITPEGFNARLAFLHQCSRQGATCSVSDTGNKLKSAGNLAFGRPPICVLRLGDFYNTKIIIESITINVEQAQWDMNPEGIGMQPMYAEISLNFKFLGGSDIEAPISRLQNAVSFNYYANQSIYDDRADKGQYDMEKNVAKIQGTPWKPNMKQTNNN